MKSTFLVLMSMAVIPRLFASSISVLPGAKTPLPINAELGSILQFSKPIKTVTPAKFFQIAEVTGADNLQKLDIKTFQVKTQPGARPEEVVFVQNDGQAISLELVAAAQVSKFYTISLEQSAKSKSTIFLQAELNMMQAMLRDDSGGFGREIVDQEVDTGVKNLSFRLLRFYTAPGFNGFVFQIQNTAGEDSPIQLSALRFDHPNRAVLAQVDKDSLTPCPFVSRSPECISTLRIVVQGPKIEVPSLLPSLHRNAPIMNKNLMEAGEIP